MAEVIRSERALGQEEEIVGFIAQDSPTAATELTERVFAASDRLGRFPSLGRVMPALHRESYRMLGITPCWDYRRVAADQRAIVHHVRRAERPLRLEDLAVE